jgi:hypothetical protein
MASDPEGKAEDKAEGGEDTENKSVTMPLSKGKKKKKSILHHVAAKMQGMSGY